MGRLAAACFAVSEVLTNAVKHSGAGRAWVDLRYGERALRIVVTDNGRGGARCRGGSGLAGVEWRLGTFDGVPGRQEPRQQPRGRARGRARGDSLRVVLAEYLFLLRAYMDPQVIQQLPAGRAGDGRPPGRLTPWEREVLELMAQGRSNAVIAGHLVVTERAIAKHMSNIFAELGLAVSDDDNRRVLAVLAYLDQGR